MASKRPTLAQIGEAAIASFHAWQEAGIAEAQLENDDATLNALEAVAIDAEQRLRRLIQEREYPEGIR